MENGKKECNNNQYYKTTEKHGSHLWEKCKHKHEDFQTSNIRKAARRESQGERSLEQCHFNWLNSCANTCTCANACAYFSSVPTGDRSISASTKK